MKVNRQGVLLINLVIGLAILVGVALAGWYLLNLNVDTHETELKVQMTRLQTSAHTYFVRLQYYDGVCHDIGVPAGFRCHANEEAYSIETTIGAGRFYCADSTGFIGETRISTGESVFCRHY